MRETSPSRTIFWSSVISTRTGAPGARPGADRRVTALPLAAVSRSGGGPTGSRSSTSKPGPVGPAVSCPPSSSARSRMPVRP